MLRRRRDSGFTLVELMVTVAIIAILAAFVLGNMSAWTTAENARKFSREVVNQIAAARRKALSTSQTYEVHLKLGSVQWLRKNSGGVIVEYGPVVQAAGGTAATGVGRIAIAGITPSSSAALSSTSTSINAAGHTPTVAFTTSTDWVISIDQSGVVDGDVTNNGTSPAPIDGLTVFVDGPNRMRIVVYPLAGIPQVMVGW